MKMRGVEKQDSATTTFDYSGRFAEEPTLREEFMRLLNCWNVSLHFLSYKYPLLIMAQVFVKYL